VKQSAPRTPAQAGHNLGFGAMSRPDCVAGFPLQDSPAFVRRRRSDHNRTRMYFHASWVSQSDMTDCVAIMLDALRTASFLLT